MLQTLKWTESFFTGLAIVLIALAIVAVPSNHVWGDPPVEEEVGIGEKACGGTSIDPNQYCVTTVCTERANCDPQR